MHKLSKSLLKKKDEIQLNPFLFLLLGFAILILTGALLLNFPFVTRAQNSIGFINALFTAGSASCVTGLTVVNTAETFNFAGQLIIIVLIQIGGLGIMTLATAFPLVMRKKIGLTSRQILKEQLNLETLGGVVRLLKYVLSFTMTTEAIGMILLGIRFVPLYGFKHGIWYAVFHSISAFCNAGFDILGDSMYLLRDDVIVIYTLMALVIIGGLGFLVTQEILFRKRYHQVSTHTKLVLFMSAILIVVGTFLFFVFEYTNPLTLAEEPLIVKFDQSIFHSVVSRTAGFYSAHLSGMRDPTSLLLIILMFIGGSPGSTAGGLKTTTFGVLLVTTVCTIKGQEEPIIFGRHIPNRTIKKALALVMVSLTLILGISFLLTISEKVKFIDLLFETVSAYATVGLSKGITPGLSAAGKLLITLTMYAGRVGPLTVGFAIVSRGTKTSIRRPEANIAIG